MPITLDPYIVTACLLIGFLVGAAAATAWHLVCVQRLLARMHAEHCRLCEFEARLTRSPARSA